MNYHTVKSYNLEYLLSISYKLKISGHYWVTKVPWSHVFDELHDCAEMTAIEALTSSLAGVLFLTALTTGV